MKKFIVFSILIAVILCLVACGNANLGLGNFTFEHAHISDAVEGYCCTVVSWHDNSSGLELHTKEFGNLFCAEGTYILFGDSKNCPFCN